MIEWTQFHIQDANNTFLDQNCNFRIYFCILDFYPIYIQQQYFRIRDYIEITYNKAPNSIAFIPLLTRRNSSIMAELIQHLAAPPTLFRFLQLPVEIRIDIGNRLSRPSNIKALCLVSKEIRDIATPRLYNKVDLTWKGGQDIPIDGEVLFLARIISLFSAPCNLRFIRKLKIGCCGPETTLALNALIPQLQENRLIEFDFLDHARYFFPRLDSYYVSGLVRKL